MNSSEWSSFLSTKGIEMHDLLGCGIVDRYPLSVQLVGKPSSITSIIAKIQLASPLRKDYRKEVKNLMKHRASVSYTGKTIQLIVQTRHMQYPYEFSQTLISLINFLANNNVQESVQCPICKEFGTDGLAYYGGVYQKLHLRCIASTLDVAEIKVQENEINGHYVTGILGGILGGLIGILPSIISILLAERIYVLLFALIPICIYYGYRLAKGRLNSLAVVITIILSVIFLFVMEYLIQVILAHQRYDLWLFSEILAIFFQKDVFIPMLKDMSMSFLFLVLGIAYSWRMISENNKKATASVEFTRSTIRPLSSSGYIPYKDEK